MTEFTLDPQLKADTIEICDLPVCKVLLMNDAQFPWLILVPRRAAITELHQLDDEDITQVQRESLLVSKLIMQHFNGEKLNTGALGNVVSQLHLHHIVRFKTDPVWPKPVWGNIQARHYNEQEKALLIQALKQLINPLL